MKENLNKACLSREAPEDNKIPPPCDAGQYRDRKKVIHVTPSSRKARRFRKNKAIIQEALKMEMAMAKAFGLIEKEEWFGRECSSIEEFCDSINISHQRAKDLIKTDQMTKVLWLDVVQDLTSKDLFAPLMSLNAESQPLAWGTSCLMTEDGNPSIEHVKKSVKAVNQLNLLLSSFGSKSQPVGLPDLKWIISMNNIQQFILWWLRQSKSQHRYIEAFIARLSRGSQEDSTINTLPPLAKP